MAVTTVSVYGRPLSAHRERVGTRIQRRLRPFSVGNMFSVTGLILACMGLPRLATLQPTTFGLLAAGVPGLLILGGVTIGTIAFIIALAQRRLISGWLALFVTMFAFRMPTVFATGLPMYGWTYKHLGVVDYIQTHGNVATNVDIYYAWPGLFTFVAWFCKLTGLEPETLALWFLPAVHVALAFAVYALARALKRTPMQSLAAAFMMEILNWIGQDYFSPQALGLLLAILVLALVFNSRKNVAYAWLSLIPFFALVITHQLTPFWVCLVVFLGCALRLIKPRYLFLLYGALALTWMVLHAYALGRYGLFSGFDLFSNASRPSYGVAVLGRTITETTMKGAAVFTWGTSALVLIIRFFRSRNRRIDVWLPLLLTFSSFVLLGGQNYGGEAIFRVLLYSLPGAGIIIGTALVTCVTWVAARRWRSMLRLLLTCLVGIMVAAVSLQAQYGTFFANTIDKSADAGFERVLHSVPVGGYTLAFAPAGPGRATGDYVAFATRNPAYDASLMDFDAMAYLNIDFADQATVADLTDELVALNRPVTLTWTAQMSRMAAYYGLYPSNAFPNLIRGLKKDGRWAVTLKKSDIIVFKLKGN